MKKLALVLLILASFGCEPEEVEPCECFKASYSLERDKTIYTYRLLRTEVVECQEEVAVKTSDNSFYIITCE